MTECQDSEYQNLVQQFRQQGYKMTPQRRAILTVLMNGAAHLTAEQIYEQVRQDMPDISLATVYNSLRELSLAQVARELDLGGRGRHYEICRNSHAHMVCLQCGAIRDLWGRWDALPQLFAPPDDFDPLKYDLTIQGYCANCRSTSTER